MDKNIRFAVYVCGRHKGKTEDRTALKGIICSAVGCTAPAKYIGFVVGDVY